MYNTSLSFYIGHMVICSSEFLTANIYSFAGVKVDYCVIMEPDECRADILEKPHTTGDI